MELKFLKELHAETAYSSKVEEAAVSTPNAFTYFSDSIEGLSLVERFRKLKSISKRYDRGILAALLGLLLVPVGVDALANSELLGNPSLPLVLTGVLSYLGLISAVVVGQVRAQKKLKEAVSELSDSENPEDIGALLEAIFIREPSHSFSLKALTRLIPQATQANQKGLTIEHQAIIYNAVEQASNPDIFWRYNPQLAVTLIKLLGKINDTQAIPLLMRLSAKIGNKPNRQEIMAAINDCLLMIYPENSVEKSPELIEYAENAELSEYITSTPSVQNISDSKSIAMMSSLNQAVRLRDRNEKIVVALTLASIAEAGGSLFISTTGSDFQPIRLVLITTACISMALLSTILFHGTYKLKLLLNQLSSKSSVAAVGPLCEVLMMEDNGLITVASILLQRLFPQLQASDSNLLNSYQRICLNRALARHRRASGLTLALLKGLEQVGDGSSLEVVEKLADGILKTSDPDKVQKAARECLPFLRDKFSKEILSRQLLRASSESSMSEADLLRPAENSNSISNDELLRIHFVDNQDQAVIATHFKSENQ